MFQANVKSRIYTFYHTTDIVEILQRDPEYRQLAQALAGLLDEEGKRNGAYPMLMPVGKVARIAVDSIYKKKRIVVIDIKWRIVTLIWRLIPSFLWRRIKL